VLAFSAAWWALVHTFVVLVEEPGLATRFGETYEHYRRHVPRWIPSSISPADELINRRGGGPASRDARTASRDPRELKYLDQS